MSKLQKMGFALIASLLLAVPAAWGLDRIGIQEPLRLLQALTGTSASFSGTLSVTGASALGDVTAGTVKAAVVDGGTSVAQVLASSGTLAVLGKSTFAGVNAGDVVLDGGARLLFNAASTHIENDGFGGVNGSWGAGSNFTGPYSTSAAITTDDYLIGKSGLKNTGTAAACTSNTGAVCVNDAAGLAIADGSGTTVATISNAGAAVFNGGATLGTSGAAITASFTGTATLDFASTLVSACSADLTITVTGATTTSIVALSVPNGSVAAGSMFFPWVSATNTVSVRHCCEAGASCDPASGSFIARAFVP